MFENTTKQQRQAVKFPLIAELLHHISFQRRHRKHRAIRSCMWLQRSGRRRQNGLNRGLCFKPCFPHFEEVPAQLFSFSLKSVLLCSFTWEGGWGIWCQRTAAGRRVQLGILPGARQARDPWWKVKQAWGRDEQRARSLELWWFK